VYLLFVALLSGCATTPDLSQENKMQDKKIRELSSQVSDMSAELDRLREENVSLKNEKDSLQKRVIELDNQLKLMKAQLEKAKEIGREKKEEFIK
jgi:peptidoglycan hydrolase CwlO-like protein